MTFFGLPKRDSVFLFGQAPPSLFPLVSGRLSCVSESPSEEEAAVCGLSAQVFELLPVEEQVRAQMCWQFFEFK
jgi:hypothetical protein